MKQPVKIVLVIVFFISFKMNSQITISEGPDMPVEKGIGYHKIIGNDSEGFFVFEQSSKGKGLSVIIDKYDSKTFKKIFSVTTKVEEIQESMNFPPYTFPEIFYGSGKVFVFFYSYDKKGKKIMCFLQTVSNNGALSDVFEVASADYEYKDPINVWAKQFFRIVFSPDNKYFAIVPLFETDDEIKDNTCTIYNTGDYKKVGEKIIPSKYQGSNLRVSNYAVDNSKNLIFTAVSYSIKDLGNRRYKTSIHGMGIGIIESNSPTAKIITIPLPENKKILDYGVSSLENGDFMIYGIISDTLAKKERYSLNSASYFVKRIEGNTLVPKYEVIQSFKEDAKKYLDDSAVKVSMREQVKTSSFKHTQVTEMNGSLYLISQHTKSYTRYSSVGKSVLPFLERTNKHILVTKLNDKGEILWSRVIPKHHIDFGLYEYSQLPFKYSGRYNVCVVDNKINFVFLDHPSNLKLEANNFSNDQLIPIRANAMGAETVDPDDTPSCVCVSIDENGGCAKQELLKYNKEGANYITIGNSILIDNNKMISFLENRKTKTQKFATINFK